VFFRVLDEMAQAGTLLLLSVDVPVAPGLSERTLFVFRPGTSFADGLPLRERRMQGIPPRNFIGAICAGESDPHAAHASRDG
jgi:hypothetical protein